MMSHIDPNWIAYLALVTWPVVAFYLYSRFPIGQATLWTILGGFLLLPVRADFKFELIPGLLDKQSIPNLTALVCCAFVTGRLPRLFRGFGVAEALICLLLIGPFITSMLNTDPVRVGPVVLPGVGIHEAVSASFVQFIFIVPFFLGRQFLRTSKEVVGLLRVMTIAGLAYSLPILFEVRMSPQLHTWLYGYLPTSFAQEMRDGGFRPVVFLGHGLLVSYFTMATTVAAAALWRTKTRIGRLRPGWITGYLSVVLVLCKTASALVFGFLLVPLVRWANPRLQLHVACVLAFIALTYPILRVADLVPTTTILEAASALSTQRADSLKVRFEQEYKLLDHAWERPWFGWGRFGRNRVYDAQNGQDTSVTDGYWVITIGVFGLTGYVAIFGLLALAVFRAAMSLKFAPDMQEAAYTAAMALLVAINMIDLLPNSSITPLTWLLVGSLLGRAETLYAVRSQRVRFPETSVLVGGAAP
jgi:hypothetical protein